MSLVKVTVTGLDPGTVISLLIPVLLLLGVLFYISPASIKVLSCLFPNTEAGSFICFRLLFLISPVSLVSFHASLSVSSVEEFSLRGHFWSGQAA